MTEEENGAGLNPEANGELEYRQRRGSEYGRGRQNIDAILSTESPRTLRLATRRLMRGVESQRSLGHSSNYRIDDLLISIADRVQVYQTLAEIDDQEAVEERLIDVHYYLRDKDGKVMYDRKTNQPIVEVDKGIYSSDLFYVDPENVIRKDTQMIEGLATELELAQDEISARYAIVRTFEEQNAMSGDIGLYAVKRFQSPGSFYAEAWQLGLPGKLKKTKEGEMSFSDSFDRAMRAWVDVAEGRIKSSPVDNMKVESPFSNEFFDERYQRGVEAVTKLADNNPAAAQLAYLVFRTLDIDVSYAVRGGAISSDSPVAKTLRLIGKITNDKYLDDNYLNGSDVQSPLKLEVSQANSDVAKAAFLGFRQLGQIASSDHEFAECPPSLAGTVTNLTGNAMEHVVLSELDGNFMEKEGGKTVSIWKLWKDGKIPWGELPWDKPYWINPLDNKTYSGIPNSMLKAPHGLQASYAVGKVFELAQMTDLKVALQIIQTPSEIKKYNKAFDVGLGTYFKGRGLGDGLSGNDEERSRKKKNLIRKVIQLNKVNIAASYLVGVTPNNSKTTGDENIDLRKEPQIAEGNVNTEVDSLITTTVRALRVGKFFSVKNRTLANLEMTTLKHIVKERRLGVKPSHLLNSWFSEEEINEINRVGLFAPFRA